MYIKNPFRNRRYIPSVNDNRPVRSVEIGPNMWQLVYADEPVPKDLRYSDYKAD